MVDVDAIIYINLAHRLDRKEHVLNEIKKIDPELAKVHRVDAVHWPAKGLIGCARSHIKALELCLEHPEWKKCMILEDDFTFTSTAALSELLAKCPKFDVLLLGVGLLGLKLEEPKCNIHRVLASQTASGYIVCSEYILTLLHNFREGLAWLSAGGIKEIFAIDMFWRRLMPSGLWYTHSTRVGHQWANYSDIENDFANYGC